MHQIHFGNGKEAAFTAIGKLYHELSEAIDLISFCQQPVNPTDVPDMEFEKTREAAQERVDEIASTIYTSLTGKEIKN